MKNRIKKHLQLTEKEAWLYLARRWKNCRPLTFAEKDSYQAEVDGQICLSLCIGIDAMVKAETISEETGAEMKEKIKPVKKTYKKMFCWDFSMKGVRSRIKFCEAQAAAA